MSNPVNTQVKGEKEVQQGKKANPPELRGYLISRFCLVLGVIVAAEFAVNLLLGTVIGVIYQILVSENITIHPMRDLMPCILYLLFSLIGDRLPVFSHVAASMMNSIAEKTLTGVPGSLLGRMQNLQPITKFAIFVVILCFIVILLLPIALGIFWYVYLVEKKVKEVEAYQQQVFDDYEKQRNLMLADIAHDLRNPITAVYGYAQALNDGIIEDPGEQQEYLTVIQDKCRRINDLIQLLMDYTKLGSTGYQMNLKRTELEELLRQNGALIYPDMEDAGMDFEVDIPETITPVEADSIQFSRVIINLLTNAIRHNPAGSVITLMMENLENEKRIYIADNGVTIPDELAAHIFEPFAMGDKSRNSGGGSGLGLAIAYKITEMHGWQLTLLTDKKDLKAGWTKAFCIRIPGEKIN